MRACAETTCVAPVTQHNLSTSAYQQQRSRPSPPTCRFPALPRFTLSAIPICLLLYLAFLAYTLHRTRYTTQPNATEIALKGWVAADHHQRPSVYSCWPMKYAVGLVNGKVTRCQAGLSRVAVPPAPAKGQATSLCTCWGKGAVIAAAPGTDTDE